MPVLETLLERISAGRDAGTLSSDDVAALQRCVTAMRELQSAAAASRAGDSAQLHEDLLEWTARTALYEEEGMAPERSLRSALLDMAATDPARALLSECLAQHADASDEQVVAALRARGVTTAPAQAPVDHAFSPQPTTAKIKRGLQRPKPR